MDNSTYSGIDQEPNGKPIRANGAAPALPNTDATPSSPQRTGAWSTANPPASASAPLFRRLDRSRQGDDYRGRSGGFSPGATASLPQAWTATHTDELAMSRMDDEGAAQSPHMRNESGEFPRVVQPRPARNEPGESPPGPTTSPSAQPPSSWWQRESLVASDVMTTKPRSVKPETKIRDIALIMKSEDVGAVPVVHDDGRLWGMITDRDIVVRALAGEKSLETCTARDIASTDLDVATPDDSLARIIELMGRERIRRVPVVDTCDRLLGIVSLADVAQHVDHHEDLQHALRRISSRRSFWSRIWR